jgi:hypothetical protein
LASVDALELELGAVEERLLGELRALRKRVRSEAIANGPACKLTPGYVTGVHPSLATQAGEPRFPRRRLAAPIGGAGARRVISACN